MYRVTNQHIPLCLNCYKTYAQIVQAELENLERSINYDTAHIASVAGLPASAFPSFPPRPIPVIVSDVKLNNINVSGSVVGTINTGSIGSIDQTISALLQLGETSTADAVKQLTEAIIGSKDITQSQKEELIEIIGAVSTEAATPISSRKNVVARTLLDRGAQILSIAKDTADVFNKYWPVLESVFKQITG